MSSYARIAHGMWGDTKFRDLTPLKPSGQALWIHLISGPHNRGVPGVFRISKTTLVEELGWSEREVDRCFAELSARGMARADWKNRLVWIPSAPKHDRPGNPNVVAGWWRQLSPLPECDLLMDALAGLRGFCEAEGPGWVEAFDKALRKAFHEGFREAFAKAFPKGCNTRVPSPCPYPTHTPPPESPPPTAATRPDPPPDPTGPVCVAAPPDPEPSTPTAAPRRTDPSDGSGAQSPRDGRCRDDAPDLGPDGDAALLAAWNAARDGKRLPLQRLTPDHREAFVAVRHAAAGDAALAVATIAEYFRSDDRFVVDAGWSVKVFPHRLDGCLVEARRRVRRNAPPPPAAPPLPVATPAERNAVLRARAAADPNGIAAKLVRDLPPEASDDAKRLTGLRGLATVLAANPVANPVDDPDKNASRAKFSP